MKIASEANPVFSNTSSEKKFTINASAQAFKILSSALYSNKISAIVRELSCNAWDSHRMAGCEDQPFDIHLPNEWEPFFYVEDRGVGLTATEIEEIYTSYFTSTKSASNDVIGGFGLGSKTPFAYTDTFTIQSRKDGVEVVYNAYIGATGEPTTALVSHSETEEPNGVRVTVPVNSVDFRQFQIECRNTHEWFAVVPNYVGFSSEFTVDNSKALELQNEEYIVGRNGNGGVKVLMGNVCYNVPNVAREFSQQIGTSQRITSFLQNHSLTIKFGIGELAVAVSRENISFEEDTIKRFLEKLEECIFGNYSKLQAEVDTNCKTVLEALKFVESVAGVWAYHMIEFKGASLYDLGDANIDATIKSILAQQTSFKPNQVAGQVFVYNNRGGRSSKSLLIDRSSQKYREVAITRKWLFVENDTLANRGLDSNCRNLVNEQHNGSLVYFVPPEIGVNDFKKKALQEELGENRVEFHKLSELKERYKIIREKVKNSTSAAPKSMAAPRAKKTQIRAKSVTGHTPSMNGFYAGCREAEARLIEIEDYENKRVAYIVRHNGFIEGRNNNSVLANKFINDDVHNLYLCDLLNLDLLVVVTPAREEALLKKWPEIPKYLDMIEDIKNINHDLAFSAHFYNLLPWGNYLDPSDKNFKLELADIIQKIYLNKHRGDYYATKEKPSPMNAMVFKNIGKYEEICTKYEPMFKKITENLRRYKGAGGVGYHEALSSVSKTNNYYGSAFNDQMINIFNDVAFLTSTLLNKYPFVEIIDSRERSTETGIKAIKDYIAALDELAEIKEQEQVVKDFQHEIDRFVNEEFPLLSEELEVQFSQAA